MELIPDDSGRAADQDPGGSCDSGSSSPGSSGSALDPTNPSGMVREIRSRLGLSQRGLAARIGLSPSTVAGLETGRQQLSLDVLHRLLAASGLRLAVFDEFGSEVLPLSDDVPRTNGGNRYPAHLDPSIPTTSPALSTMGLGVHTDRPARVFWYSQRKRRDGERLVEPTPADHPSTAEYRQAARDHWPSRRQRQRDQNRPPGSAG